MRTSTRTSQGLLTCVGGCGPKWFPAKNLLAGTLPNKTKQHAYCCASKGGVPQSSPQQRLRRNRYGPVARIRALNGPAAVPARAIGVSLISTAFYRCAPLTRLTAAPQTVTIDASLNGLGEAAQVSPEPDVPFQRRMPRSTVGTWPVCLFEEGLPGGNCPG